MSATVPARATSAAIAAVAGLGLLAACDKPAPRVTVQSGAQAVQVTPTTYVFDAAHVRTLAPTLPVVTAATGGTVLVDVPGAVADAGWAVTAYGLNGASSTLTKAIGGSGAIHDRHSYRIAAQTNNGSPFIVQVQKLAGGKTDGSTWSFLVKVDDGT